MSKDKIFLEKRLDLVSRFLWQMYLSPSELFTSANLRMIEWVIEFSVLELRWSCQWYFVGSS